MGKTSLVSTYATGRFVGLPYLDWEPYTSRILIGRNVIDFSISDVSCWRWDKYEIRQNLANPRPDILVICFSLVDQASLKNVKVKWLPKVQRHCPGVPIILLGTKLDLRECNKTIKRSNVQRRIQPVTYQQGRSMARSIGAVEYLECSAKTQKGHKAVFDKAVRTVCFPSPIHNTDGKKNGGCRIM